MSAPEKKCRHKERRRKHINSCVSQCLDCGMLYAMIAGKTSISRKWVKPDDPRVELGKAATKKVLERERELAKSRAMLKARILGAPLPKPEHKPEPDDLDPNCHMCRTADPSEACPRHCRCSYCVKKRETFERGYQAGLRRAQELARRKSDTVDAMCGSAVDLREFDRFIEAEVSLALVDLVSPRPSIKR